MKLYLIRHGQTMWNSEGKIQGKTDIPLNEAGLLQAEILAEAMERHPVTAVYASPLKRAYQTAECVAGRQGLSVIAEEGLREVDFGLWEGMTWREIGERYPEDFVLWDKNPAEHSPTGGERREDSQARISKAMERITGEARGDVALVAHGGILVFAVLWLIRKRQEKNEIIVKNASITTVEYDRKTGEGRLLCLNDVSHLGKFCSGDGIK